LLSVVLLPKTHCLMALRLSGLQNLTLQLTCSPICSLPASPASRRTPRTNLPVHAPVADGIPRPATASARSCLLPA